MQVHPARPSLAGAAPQPAQASDAEPYRNGKWMDENGKRLTSSPGDMWRAAVRAVLSAPEGARRASRTFGTAEPGKGDDVLTSIVPVEPKKGVRRNTVLQGDLFVDTRRQYLNPKHRIFRYADIVTAVVCTISCTLTPWMLSFGPTGRQGLGSLCVDACISAWLFAHLLLLRRCPSYSAETQSYMFVPRAGMALAGHALCAVPWFLPHLVASHLDGEEGMGDTRYLKALRTLDVARLLLILRLETVQEHLRTVYSRRTALVLRVVNISLVFVMMVHWAACVVWAITFEADEGELVWSAQLCRLREQAPDCVAEMHVSRRYAFCVSYAFTVVSTVGFSFYTPATPEEAALASLGCLVGMFMHAIVVGNVLEIVTESQAEQRRYQTIIQRLHFYAERHNIPVELRDDMVGYINQQWSMNRLEDDSEVRPARR